MPMLVRPALLLVLVALPLLEIALLIKLGQLIGFWPALGSVVGSALLGAHVLRSQGLASFARVNAALAADETPVLPVMEGALLLLAGTLLILPGVLTDCAGLALLVPQLRRWLARMFMDRAGADIGVTVFTSDHEARWPHDPAGTRRSAGGTRHDDGGIVIDGEFERLDERPMKPRDTRQRDA